MQDPFWCSAPPNVLPQPRQTGIESVGEVDVLARLKPKGHLGFLVEHQWNDWFVILESPCPFSLALGVGADTIFSHDVENTCASAQSPDDLFVPIYARLKIAAVKPNRNARWPRSKLVSQGEHDVLAIATRITDEIERLGHELSPSLAPKRKPCVRSEMLGGPAASWSAKVSTMSSPSRRE